MNLQIIDDRELLSMSEKGFKANGQLICTSDRTDLQENVANLDLPKTWTRHSSYPSQQKAASDRGVFTRYLSRFIATITRHTGRLTPDFSLLLAHPMFSRVTGIDDCYKIFCEIGEGLIKASGTLDSVTLVTENKINVRLHFGDRRSMEAIRAGMLKLSRACRFPFLLIPLGFRKILRLSKLDANSTKKNRRAFESAKVLLIISHIPLKILENKALITANDFADYFFGKHWIPVAQKGEFKVLFVLADQGADKATKKALRAQIEADKGFVLFDSEILTKRDVVRASLEAGKAWFFAFRLFSTRLYSRRRVDVLSQTLLRDASSTSVFHNRCLYLGYSALGRQLAALSSKVNLLFPYEGRANERMASMAFRNTSAASIRGYMHFPISEKHIGLMRSPIEDFCYGTNFRFGTFGQANARKLSALNNWPTSKIFLSGFLKPGVSYRKIPTTTGPIRDVKILLLLAMDIGANQNFCTTVASALKKLQSLSFEVSLRKHPSLPLDLASLEKLFGQTLIESGGDLVDSLTNTDLVLYGETGASLEVVGFGPPLIYVSDCRYASSDRIAVPSLLEASCVDSNELARALEVWAGSDRLPTRYEGFDRDKYIEIVPTGQLLTEIFQFS